MDGIPTLDDLATLTQANVDALPDDRRASVDKSSTISFQDHFDFQTVQSEAFAAGRIALTISQWLYATLGGSVEVFNGQPIGRRIVALHAIANLIPKRPTF